MLHAQCPTRQTLAVNAAKEGVSEQVLTGFVGTNHSGAKVTARVRVQIIVSFLYVPGLSFTFTPSINVVGVKARIQTHLLSPTGAMFERLAPGMIDSSRSWNSPLPPQSPPVVWGQVGGGGVGGWGVLCRVGLGWVLGWLKGLVWGCFRFGLGLV